MSATEEVVWNEMFQLEQMGLMVVCPPTFGYLVYSYIAQALLVLCWVLFLKVSFYLGGF